MNNQSSIGLTEELTTTLINLVALEYHLRITYEKYHSLLNIKKVSDKTQQVYLRTKLQSTLQLLDRTTNQRRAVMGVLSNLGTEEANKDMWCSVKHSSVQMITMFEAWQVDFNNSQLEELYHKSVELFNLTLADFLGYTPQPCSACFSDAVRSQEELNSIMGHSATAVEAVSAEEVFDRAKEVFGDVPEFVPKDISGD